MKVETEIKVTTEQRVQIRALLDKHFDDAAGLYLDDMSDEKLAVAAKIPRAVVERMRETAYGPIRVTAEVVALRDEIAKFRSQKRIGICFLPPGTISSAWTQER